MINTHGQRFIEYVQFKDELIKMRQKLKLGTEKDKAGLLEIRSIKYHKFLKIKCDLANKVMKHIGTKNDSRFNVSTKKRNRRRKKKISALNCYFMLNNQII